MTEWRGGGGATSAAAGVSDHGDLTGLGDDDHTAYATNVELTAHEGAANPHAVYETSAEAAAKVTTHEAAADPHAGYLLESLYDAKGDLLAASADNTPAKLTVGSNNQALVADSAQAAGLKWADLPLVGAFPATFDGRLATATGTISAANRGIYMLVMQGVKQTINTLHIHVATSSGNISAAVYTSTGTGRSRAPASRIATSGAVACGTLNTEQVITLDGTVTVTPFETWFFLSADNNTATFARVTTIAASPAKGLATFQSTAHPAPTSAASLTDSSISVWIAGSLV